MSLLQVRSSLGLEVEEVSTLDGFHTVRRTIRPPLLVFLLACSFFLSFSFQNPDSIGIPFNTASVVAGHMSARKRRPSTAEVIVDTAQKASRTVENALTVLWNDLPSWQQDNHYIHSGYRPASHSFWKSFASLSYLHNESVNIYSHLLGAVIFYVSGLFLYSSIRPRYESATSSDILAFGCFFLGAALCLGMSATYHTVSNHSPTVARFGNKLDYLGIVCLITGSFIPSVFYGFYCHPHWQEFYWTMVCRAHFT